MKKLLFLTTFVLYTLVVSRPLVAQDSPASIKYGETVTGEITNRHFEIEYQFEGAKGDVFLAEMKAVDSSNFYDTAIIFLDADYNVLGSLNGSLFFAELPADGTYSLLATRRDGRGGKGTGTFMLKLSKMLPLEVGTALRGKVGPETVDYYVVKSTTPFTIAYEKQSRGFCPQVVISTLQNNSLSEYASLSGATLTSGSLGIAPEADSGSLFILTVQKAGRYYNPDTETVTYSITLTQ